MNSKLNFWKGLSCTVLMAFGPSAAFAGGHHFGQFNGGMSAKSSPNVTRSFPTQQTQVLNTSNFKTQTPGISEMPGVSSFHH